MTVFAPGGSVGIVVLPSQRSNALADGFDEHLLIAQSGEIDILSQVFP